MAILSVENLTVEFPTQDGVVHAVDDISFNIREKQKIGLVGESGAGKSVTGHAIIQLIENPGTLGDNTSILWKGEDLSDKSESELDHIRGNEIGWIPQNPLSSLNPTKNIGDQIIETLKTHNYNPEISYRKRAIELLEKVGIPDPETRLSDYPHEYSGGMRQRVLIAIALSCDPDLIIADEPTTALDVLIQAQILNLLDEIIEEFNSSLLFITHDLGLLSNICEHIMVMYAGEIVEKSPVDELFNDPLHPYTRELLHCSPIFAKDGKLNTIPGSVPDGANYPSGCRFHPRCPDEMEECSKVNPSPRNVRNGRIASCLLYESGQKESE